MAVHKESIAIASVAQEHGAEGVSLGTSGTRQCAIDKRIRQLQSKSQPRVFVSEAGPCGSWLYRSLTKNGHLCGGVAPALLPTKTGERVNTDRRDAMQLARLMRSGDRTPVYVPAGDDAASRDLSRAREDTRRDLQAAQLRLQAFLRRPEIRSPGRANWSPAPLRWRSEVGCPTPAQQMVLPASVQTVTEQTERLGRLELARHAPGKTWRVAPGGEALQALRGVQCTVAVTTVAALGALTRFEHPRQLRNALGLPPSASSSGGRRPQGSRTKTGTTPARRALGEGAWASRSPATVSRPLPRRLAKRPAAMQAIRWQAQVRRCKRYRPRMAKGKKAQQVVVAMARERVGFMGARAKQVAVPPNAARERCVDAHALEVATRYRKRRRPGVV